MLDTVYFHGSFLPHRTRSGKTPWTAAKVARLVALWNAGKSAGSINREADFACFSRNAIIGKIHRLMKKGTIITRRDAPTDHLHYRNPQPGSRRYNKELKAEYDRKRWLQMKADRAAALLRGPDNSNPVTLMDVETYGCRFIVGGDRENSLFCNAPTHDNPRADGARWCYCRHHYLRMTVAGTRR
jgi:hypothetical protein